MRWEDTDRQIDKLTWLRDRAAHRVQQTMRARGLEGSLAEPGREALKALKTRLYSEARSEEDCDALEARMLAEVELLAAQPTRPTLEERVAELAAKLETLERRAERPE